MIFLQSNKGAWSWPVRIAVIAAILLSGGCTTLERIKTAVTSDPVPARKTSVASDARHGPASRAAAQAALAEGIELYDKGQFNAAIKRLNAPAVSSADTSVQTEALKYKAFSYCVTSRQTLCAQQFEKALKLDPDFDLERGEKGHPLWGPVFDRAKTSD